MGDNNLKSLEELKGESKELDYDYTEKFATISDDKKSLLIRIPQDIRKKVHIKAGDKIRFFAIYKEDEKPKLKIEWVKKDAG
ncbi:AbrB/MazE/SpoVT family DNA-binding domain-containing protein [Candidatus Woesearchaeota archaeon]|jgi:hypothetical protein|nr:AbrB/MazE/SpoVT family DNA-binding domain-containing protein [Candidatus Woesearchaeota archaeon]MBT7238131.1 AbrB/MazE/SpoVT family DNA-binding domain-containing protein [Candidatus Woesearchaeota archaeon]